MTYRIPDMALSVNVWHGGGGPPSPPDLSVLGNLSIGRRVFATTGIPNDVTPDTVVVKLLIPALTDIRDAYCSTGADTVEVPAGSGRLYTVKQVDDVGKGYVNEYRFAIISKISPWPTPIP